MTTIVQKSDQTLDEIVSLVDSIIKQRGRVFENIQFCESMLAETVTETTGVFATMYQRRVPAFFAGRYPRSQQLAWEEKTHLDLKYLSLSDVMREQGEIRNALRGHKAEFLEKFQLGTGRGQMTSNNFPNLDFFQFPNDTTFEIVVYDFNDTYQIPLSGNANDTMTVIEPSGQSNTFSTFYGNYYFVVNRKTGSLIEIDDAAELEATLEPSTSPEEIEEIQEAADLLESTIEKRIEIGRSKQSWGLRNQLPLQHLGFFTVGSTFRVIKKQFGRRTTLSDKEQLSGEIREVENEYRLVLSGLNCQFHKGEVVTISYGRARATAIYDRKEPFERPYYENDLDQIIVTNFQWDKSTIGKVIVYSGGNRFTFVDNIPWDLLGGTIESTETGAKGVILQNYPSEYLTVVGIRGNLERGDLIEQDLPSDAPAGAGASQAYLLKSSERQTVIDIEGKIFGPNLDLDATEEELNAKDVKGTWNEKYKMLPIASAINYEERSSKAIRSRVRLSQPLQDGYESAHSVPQIFKKYLLKRRFRDEHDDVTHDSHTPFAAAMVIMRGLQPARNWRPVGDANGHYGYINDELYTCTDVSRRSFNAELGLYDIDSLSEIANDYFNDVAKSMSYPQSTSTMSEYTPGLYPGKDSQPAFPAVINGGELQPQLESIRLTDKDVFVGRYYHIEETFYGATEQGEKYRYLIDNAARFYYATTPRLSVDGVGFDHFRTFYTTPQGYSTLTRSLNYDMYVDHAPFPRYGNEFYPPITMDVRSPKLLTRSLTDANFEAGFIADKSVQTHRQDPPVKADDAIPSALEELRGLSHSLKNKNDFNRRMTPLSLPIPITGMSYSYFFPRYRYGYSGTQAEYDRYMANYANRNVMPRMAGSENWYWGPFARSSDVGRNICNDWDYHKMYNIRLTSYRFWKGVPELVMSSNSFFKNRPWDVSFGQTNRNTTHHVVYWLTRRGEDNFLYAELYVATIAFYYGANRSTCARTRIKILFNEQTGQHYKVLEHYTDPALSYEKGSFASVSFRGSWLLPHQHNLVQYHFHNRYFIPRLYNEYLITLDRYLNAEGRRDPLFENMVYPFIRKEDQANQIQNNVYGYTRNGKYIPGFMNDESGDNGPYLSPSPRWFSSTNQRLVATAKEVERNQYQRYGTNWATTQLYNTSNISIPKKLIDKAHDGSMDEDGTPLYPIIPRWLDYAPTWEATWYNVTKNNMKGRNFKFNTGVDSLEIFLYYLRKAIYYAKALADTWNRWNDELRRNQYGYGPLPQGWRNKIISTTVLVNRYLNLNTNITDSRFGFQYRDKDMDTPTLNKQVEINLSTAWNVTTAVVRFEEALQKLEPHRRNYLSRLDKRFGEPVYTNQPITQPGVPESGDKTRTKFPYVYFDISTFVINDPGIPWSGRRVSSVWGRSSPTKMNRPFFLTGETLVSCDVYGNITNGPNMNRPLRVRCLTFEIEYGWVPNATVNGFRYVSTFGMGKITVEDLGNGDSNHMSHQPPDQNKYTIPSFWKFLGLLASSFRIQPLGGCWLGETSRNVAYVGYNPFNRNPQRGQRLAPETKYLQYRRVTSIPPLTSRDEAITENKFPSLTPYGTLLYTGVNNMVSAELKYYKQVLDDLRNLDYIYEELADARNKYEVVNKRKRQDFIEEVHDQSFYK